MKVYGLWHGGYSYGPPCLDNDLEIFDSIAEAKHQFWLRWHDGFYSKQKFVFARSIIIPQYAYTPTVDESATMWLYLYDPREVIDPYPDRIITIGPREGIRMEKC